MKKAIKVLIEQTNKKIQEAKPKFYWDQNDNLSAKQAKDIIEGNQVSVEEEIYNYNIDHVCDLEKETRTEAIKENLDAFRKLLKDPEINAEEILEQFEFEYPEVDINMKGLSRYSELRIRLTLHSNYDCMNSYWFESQSGFTYKESYFGAVIDFLNLNPAEVKKMLIEMGDKVYGAWPNKPNRDTKGLCRIEEFKQELQNSTCPANNFIIIGKIKITDILDRDEKFKSITFPKNSHMGFYSSWQGGGSILEAKLARDTEFKIGQTGKSTYDCNVLEIDEKDADSGYCTDEVYGLTHTCFKLATI